MYSLNKELRITHSREDLSLCHIKKNSEEYKIVESLDTKEDKLSENQKNKMLFYSDFKEEKSSLCTKYSEKL